jgi:uncharacterized sulfatase
VRILKVLMGFAASVMACTVIAAPSAPPNIVVFVSDDHGYLDSSVTGATEFRTPNMERLARDGITFTQAFAASPTCAPSRASFLTGLMPNRSGSLFNHQPPSADVRKLPAYSKELGYEVAAFGKIAHYNQADLYGFDRAELSGFHEDECVSAAVEYLRKRESNKPLCLLVGTNWPHVPWPEVKADDGKAFRPPASHVDTPETRHWRAKYAAAVEEGDRDLGQVYAAAYARLGRNTLFIHYSDHGGQWPFGKWNLYDAGTRVPFFAVWPGVIAAGRESDAMLSLVDVLPTLVDAAGATPPSEIDGQSFLDVLKGKRAEHREEVFTTHSGDGDKNRFPIRAVRNKKWKYIRNLRPENEHHTHIDRAKPVDGNAYWKSWVAAAKDDATAAAIVERYHHRLAEELYDLEADPLEQKNLAGDARFAAVRQQLATQLDDWMREQGDEGTKTEDAVAKEFYKDEEREVRQVETVFPEAAKRGRAKPSLDDARGRQATDESVVGRERRLNVLFIAVDDLRPQLGCYGASEMKTPSIDQMASEGRRFNHHYVQVPTCGASRLAMLTGQYPSEPAAYDNNAFKVLPRTRTRDPISIPELFQRNGYATVSIGKISHSPDGRRDDGKNELANGWDEVGMPHGEWKDAWAAFFAYAGGKTRIVRETPVTEKADLPDSGYPDGLIADAAIAKLGELKDEPFFLTVGFIKPHLPFNAPSRYWDMYDPAALPAAANPLPPTNVDPSISLHQSGEMRGQYTGFSQPGIVTEDEGLHLNHAYRACVSYVDAQIGRVLGELDRLGLREKTIVVLWGDHGWHLGEQGIWGKHTLHEVALRSPLVIRAPGMASPGSATDGIVESVDIFPTLADLCGLPAPSGLSGRSMVPMLEDANAPGKPAAFGFWKNGRGHSIRTPRYRLTMYTERDEPSRVIQTELYDHEADPLETENIAAERLKVVRELTKELRKMVPMLKSGSRDGAVKTPGRAGG